MLARLHLALTSCSQAKAAALKGGRRACAPRPSLEAQYMGVGGSL